MGEIMPTVTKATACLLSIVMILSGCVAPSGSRSGAIGPQLSSFFDKKPKVSSQEFKPKLDVVIPLFDPGLQNGTDTDERVWPELRRAESVRFAYKMKEALESTGRFGAVRVTPDRTATGDLYVLGKIKNSDGENVEIDIEVFDISGARWFGKSFDHGIDNKFYVNSRNNGKDPYDPVFGEVAASLTKEIGYYGAAELKNIQRLADLRFGASFSEDAFSEHFVVNNGVYALNSFPSEQDPMLKRTQAIRVRDRLFVDGLQDEYREFSQKMETSYLIWQEQAHLELRSERQAKAAAAGQAILGILTIGLAVAAVAAGADTSDWGTATAATTAGIVAGAAGAHFLGQSFQTSREAKVHSEALEELGNSIDLELSPQVVAFEEKTVELQGTASQQFAQWRNFLKKIYAQEATPDVKL